MRRIYLRFRFRLLCFLGRATLFLADVFMDVNASILHRMKATIAAMQQINGAPMHYIARDK